MTDIFDKEALLSQIMNEDRLSDVLSSKILIVGSGGIGVEIIKNVILLGFRQITIIDLDTIDVSNLNRQFLFNKSHVGKSKSMVAASVSMESFAYDPETINIKPIEGSIMNPEYDVDFFRQFRVVVNALDNRASRSHVNRMCFAANVPLIESGSEGYLGQVFLIKRNVSACYECEGPRQDQKTYASCTIRNTPSLPIHCIVWGKHLFAQLFGEEDADNDVSPDMNDPEMQVDNGAVNGNAQIDGSDVSGDDGSIKNGKDSQSAHEISESQDAPEKPQAQPSTRQWAISKNYNSELLFTKLFKTDIDYLLRMDKLWQNRRKPDPLALEDIGKDHPESAGCSSSISNGKISGSNEPTLKDQRLWSLKECYERFRDSVNVLKQRLANEGFLVWDKDDEKSLDFVTAVSNLRCHCFGIERKSRFDVKSMAGNIIPAISSTNSIISGLITLQLVNLLRNLVKLDPPTDQKDIDDVCKNSCKCIYLRKMAPNARNLISSYQLFEPNQTCIICSGETAEFEVTFNFNETSMADFVEQILMKRLNFVCPDVRIDGQPLVIFSKDDADEYEEDERQIYKKRPLSENVHVRNKVRLKIDDLLQNYKVIVTLKDEAVIAKLHNGNFFSMVCTSNSVQSAF